MRWWQRAAGILMVLLLLAVGWKMRAFIWTAVQNAVVKSWYPVWETNLRDISDSEAGKRRRLAEWKKRTQGEADPSYYKYLEEQEVRQEYMDFLAQFSGSKLAEGTLLGKWNGLVCGSGGQDGGEMDEESLYGAGKNGEKIAGANAMSQGQGSGENSESGSLTDAADESSAVASGNGMGVSNPVALVDSPRLRKKLEDYDYLVQHFFTIHPTAAIDRRLMNAEAFLSMDLTIEKDETDGPQILIYHTHSQENYADQAGSGGKGAVVALGEELAERLRAKGYQVWHDTTAYDMKSGHLDRSRAYTYACEGVTNLLQKYPSIQVILDVHRDGVSEQTHLVTQIDGKPTARIMFFNGTSETPDGAIEYLANPYRKENLAFSFQMKWDADQRYPGFTRTIYLKGLRYNLHLRPRSALIEVGAQTNTYEEAVNAMDPLAELLDRVLTGER